MLCYVILDFFASDYDSLSRLYSNTPLNEQLISRHLGDLSVNQTGPGRPINTASLSNPDLCMCVSLVTYNEALTRLCIRQSPKHMTAVPAYIEHCYVDSVSQGTGDLNKLNHSALS